MRTFKLEIVGGTDQPPSRKDLAESTGRPTANDVQQEARRRLAAAGYAAMQIRVLLTGWDMPAALRYLGMQIEFVASTLEAQRPIPEDFRSDRYWPAMVLPSAAIERR